MSTNCPRLSSYLPYNVKLLVEYQDTQSMPDYMTEAGPGFSPQQIVKGKRDLAENNNYQPDPDPEKEKYGKQ